MTVETRVDDATIEPDDIDLEFKPRALEGVAEVKMDGDLVLVAGAFTAGVMLNPTAELLWRCLDGKSSLAALVAELDEATGAGAETIGADLLETVRAFGHAGLLEGVVPHAHRTERAESTLAVGQPVEPLARPGLDGRSITVGGSSERRVLLVNWSPHCGYCVEIARELLDLRPQLDASGVELVFLTSGDPEANRAVFGSDDPPTALLRPIDDDDGTGPGRTTFSDPFADLGTPAAYLLAVDGTVAEPLAYGAAEVPVLARRLAGLDATHPDAQGEARPEAAAANGIRYLAEPGAACAPGAGGATAPVWADRRVLRVGDHHVGVACNTVEAAAILDRLLPGVLVDDDKAPVNYSIVLPPAAERGARALNLLVRGGEHLVRSRSAARVLQALLYHVSSVAPADPTLLRVGSIAAVRNERAVLLPVGVKVALKALQPHFFRMGLQLVDVPWALVDPRARELVVPEPGIDHDPSVLDDLARGARLGAELTSVAPGRYPIDVWYVLGLPGSTGPTTPAMALSCVAGLIDTSTDLQARVGELAALVSTLPVHRIWWESHAELRAQLAAGLPG